MNSLTQYAWTFQVTPENSIHLMWLIPQYFVMTMGEVLMSVTGLQFSFTQVSWLFSLQVFFNV